MGYKKKSWKEKLADNKKFPKILPFDPKFPCGKSLAKMGAQQGDRVVLVQPREVVEIMNQVPNGKLITLREICQKLALKHNVEYCCTLTTGIFIVIAAHAAEEDKMEGKEEITPYWRTLKIDGYLNDKYPGGAKTHKKLLESEGFRILSKGKNFVVDNYEDYLIK
ncbi:MAG: MGMT family protein [Candidatus Thermoplasmatota archaeon]